MKALVIILLFIAAIVCGVGVLALEAWVLMLLIGAIVSVTSLGVALGFWAVVLIIITLDIVFSLIGLALGIKR